MYYILKKKYIFQFKQFFPTVVSPKIKQPPLMFILTLKVETVVADGM